jgi:hypothetical protein
MSLHKQPRELAELKGAHKVQPGRYRDKIPKSELPLGAYPSDRSTEPEDCWFEISSMCIPGVLTGADRIIMEIASDLLGEYREDHQKFASAKLSNMISCLARFGMSPSDRNSLGIDKKESDNPFANLDD